MISQRDFIVTLINAGKSTDNIQSLIIDCYGDKAYTRRIRRLMLGEMAKTTDLNLLLGLTSNVAVIKELMDADGRLTRWPWR